MAASPNSTGFFFDVKAWRGSRAVQRMSMAERGVFLEMLCEQWERRNLPDDANQVAETITCTDAQAAEVLAAWPVVRRKFLTSRGDQTRIYNETLERTRRKQSENRRKRIEAGALGGKARAAKLQTAHNLQPSIATALPSNAQANPSYKTRLDKTRPDLSRPDQTRDLAASRFAEFYAAYPRKEARPKALAAFLKLNPDDALLARMVDAVRRSAASEQWLKDGGRYIPLPATWLNQRRWEDEGTALPVAALESETWRHNMAVADEVGRLIEAGALFPKVVGHD